MLVSNNQMTIDSAVSMTLTNVDTDISGEMTVSYDSVTNIETIFGAYSFKQDANTGQSSIEFVNVGLQDGSLISLVTTKLDDTFSCHALSQISNNQVQALLYDEST